ncbi:segregation/condensation protein A [Mycoplasmoides pirum]|uniref:segregation/condensation protein A n=1 Tax=Mycoplasmoides pirum TaxID=2122 RepID=UPI000696A805|nr:segregation/condensation protein A [Mycoplasmoides pirum]
MVKMIWCEDIKHGIGKNNSLPWKIPEEMEHFKKTTMNKVVVMGFNTYKSMGKLLPNRINIIMTKNHKSDVPKDALIYQTAKSVLKDFQDVDIYVIGGKLIYELFLEFADELIVSRLSNDFKCDTKFNPKLNEFNLIEKKSFKKFDVFYYRRKNDLNNISNSNLEPIDNIFNLSFLHFVGPFDLLLALIQDKKMDILNLDLAELTAQYLKFIKENMKNVDIEQITDYLVMATYLIELKSKQIIPSTDDENEEDYDLSNNKERDRLVKHLIEYKHYREVIPKLEELQLNRSQMIGKEADEWNAFQVSNDDLPEAPLPNYMNPDRLLVAMQRIFNRLKNKSINSPKIVVEELSIEDVQNEIYEIIKNSKSKQITLTQLLSKVDQNKLNQMYFVTCFVALLVLTRYQKIDMFQKKVNDEIYIELNTKPISNEPEETIEEMIKRQEDFKRETEEYRKQIMKQRAEEYQKKREMYLKEKYGDAYVSREEYRKMSDAEKLKLRERQKEINKNNNGNKE